MLGYVIVSHQWVKIGRDKYALNYEFQQFMANGIGSLVPYEIDAGLLDGGYK